MPDTCIVTCIYYTTSSLPIKKQSKTDCVTIVKGLTTMPSTVHTIHEQLEENPTTCHVPRSNLSEQVEYTIESDILNTKIVPVKKA